MKIFATTVRRINQFQREEKIKTSLILLFNSSKNNNLYTFQTFKPLLNNLYTIDGYTITEEIASDIRVFMQDKVEAVEVRVFYFI